VGSAFLGAKAALILAIYAVHSTPLRAGCGSGVLPRYCWQSRVVQIQIVQIRYVAGMGNRVIFPLRRCMEA
jgi:hypothetical protein